MPAGRYPKTFGYSHVTHLSYVVSGSSMRKHRKKGAAALTRVELKDLRKHLRLAFWMYQTDHKAPHPTRTTQSGFLERVRTSARRFLERPNTLWANRLLGNIAKANDYNRLALYLALDGFSWKAIFNMRRHLNRLHPLIPREAPNGQAEDVESAIFAVVDGEESRIPPSCVHQDTMDEVRLFVAEHLPVVRAMAALMVPGASGHWPNPALATLVLGVEPIWKDVTDRTSGLTSFQLAATAQNLRRLARLRPAGFAMAA